MNAGQKSECLGRSGHSPSPSYGAQAQIGDGAIESIAGVPGFVEFISHSVPCVPSVIPKPDRWLG
jgi:hypothetical protein